VSGKQKGSASVPTLFVATGGIHAALPARPPAVPQRCHKNNNRLQYQNNTQLYDNIQLLYQYNINKHKNILLNIKKL
jgi:hypothetical protein